MKRRSGIKILLLSSLLFLVALRMGPGFHVIPLSDIHAKLQEFSSLEGTAGLLWNEDSTDDNSEAIKHRIATIPSGSETQDHSINEPVIRFNPCFLSDPLLIDRPPPVLHS
jgi:hypothetical protein